ncbi:MAG: polysaccharide biosynthesis/export family protein [Muribaculaceae bacterium]|nr:polysaccharide biosynthesis/export family protein [Muribaculaceae bacterium]
MNRSHITLLSALLCILALASCSTKKTVLPYFADIPSVADGSFETGSYLSKIRPDDQLLITVNSLDPAATSAYSLPYYNPGSDVNILNTAANATPLPVVATSMQLQTYIVNTEGDIYFPVLGKIHVAGMTTEELQKYLTERISADVEDPVVNVRIANFEVVVGGEVKSPKKIRVNRNRYSVLDALGDAGDLTEYGERSNILLVREIDGRREYHRLNLNSSDLLTSPYFYLQQNDYIYVEPNAVRQANSKYNQHNSFKLQVISTIVSASSVLASLIIALAIK